MGPEISQGGEEEGQQLPPGVELYTDMPETVEVPELSEAERRERGAELTALVTERDAIKGRVAELELLIPKQERSIEALSAAGAAGDAYNETFSQYQANLQELADSKDRLFQMGLDIQYLIYILGGEETREKVIEAVDWMAGQAAASLAEDLDGLDIFRTN